ncbi:MAG: YebC/PmpR family DNA-binding transcriptional regulator [bacterium]
MSGHSRWATIRRKKASIDAKRGKVFTKIIKEITVAARIGGGDPNGNPRLRLALAGARSTNMPQDTITRAIKKGTGELEGVSYDEVCYEGYGAGGTAFMVDVVTDNRNRTVAELRHMFTKNSGNLGETGSVGWMFERRGQLLLDPALDEDRVTELALEAGAEDVRRTSEGGEWQILTAPTDLDAVRQAVEAAGITPTAVEITRIPKDTIKLSGAQAGQVLRLFEALEDHDDVQKVHANFEIADEEMDRLAAESA